MAQLPVHGMVVLGPAPLVLPLSEKLSEGGAESAPATTLGGPELPARGSPPRMPSRRES